MTDAAPAPKKSSILKKVLIGIVAVLAIFLVVVALQPAEYAVTRSATVAAPAQAVFDLVNDFHKWDAWSPWEKLDPAMKKTFEGPPSGTGSIYAWAGNSQVGEGKMTLTESRPAERIRIKLEFLKPMEGTSDTEFTFKPQGAQTAVTWTMTGRNNFVSKAICLFMNMDKMVGGQFEKGLEQIKTLAEQKK